MADPIFLNFIGTWSLDTESCDYEQGEPPHADRHQIAEDNGELVITMDWTDAEGESHHASFRGPPDGRKIPFNGGPLADSLQVSATSPTVLELSAFSEGLELMTAKRTLNSTGSAFQLVQTVYLADFTTPTNRGTYLKIE